MSLETIWNHIHQTYLFPIFEPVIPWKTARYADIDVYYKEYIEVGGATFGQNFIPFLRDRGMPKQQRAFEWCCGAGFIAFHDNDIDTTQHATGRDGPAPRSAASPTSTTSTFRRSRAPAWAGG